MAPITHSAFGPQSLGAAGAAVPAPIQPPAGPSFASTLVDAVKAVNNEQIDAREAVRGLASGQNVDLHGTMIALEKAEISLRAMASVRDKVIGAYEQVMNMAI